MPAIRDYMVRRALTEKKGVVTNEDELISFEAVDDLDPDEVLKLLEWLGDHLLYFFVTSAGNMSRQAKEYSNELGLSNLSTSGSPDSASTTQSAGPSASLRAISRSFTGRSPFGNCLKRSRSGMGRSEEGRVG